MQIMYGVGGERRLTEASLEHLEGYRGGETRTSGQRRGQPVAAGRLWNAARANLALAPAGKLP